MGRSMHLRPLLCGKLSLHGEALIFPKPKVSSQTPNVNLYCKIQYYPKSFATIVIHPLIFGIQPNRSLFSLRHYQNRHHSTTNESNNNNTSKVSDKDVKAPDYGSSGAEDTASTKVDISTSRRGDPTEISHGLKQVKNTDLKNESKVYDKKTDSSDANNIEAKSSPTISSVTASQIPMSKVVRAMGTHLWPENRWDLRLCVVGSITCVIASKLLKTGIPFWFKSIVDALSIMGSATATGASATTSATASATATTSAAAASSIVPTVGASFGGVGLSAAGAAVVVGPFTLGVFAMVTAYGITRVTAIMCDESKTAVFAPVGAQASTDISMRLFNKLHSLDLSFHLNRQTGVLAKDIDRGSRAFWGLAYALIFMIVPTAFEMCLVAGVLQCHAGVYLSATAAGAVLSYLAWTYVITQRRVVLRDMYNKGESKMGGMIVDSLLNYETVKFFTNEKYEEGRLSKVTSETNGHLMRLDQNMALMNFGQQFIFAVAGALCLYLSIHGVLAGYMTVGDLVLVDALLLQLYTPLSWLGLLYRDLNSSTQNMQGMLALMMETDAIVTLPDAKHFHYKNGTIEFKNVCFRYKDNSRDVLNNVSFTIPGGKTVAFVGPSGSGKSTIFRLLFRFFDPTSGEVIVDGQPLKSINLDTYREEVGVIPQDTVLFNDTIMYNIRYGNIQATDEEVQKASQLADIHESIVRLQDGYSTTVGERGLKLSGGEKQRIAIARVILKGAPILLADEATSALDTKSERNVMVTLKKAARWRKEFSLSKSSCGTSPIDHVPKSTLVIIAHRLSTIKDADCIFVLNSSGSLVEQGTHEELLATPDGIYHNLWNDQLKSNKHVT